MSKFEKHAWVELVAVGVMVLYLSLVLHSLAKKNVQGADFVVIMIVIGSVGAALWTAIERRIEAGYDEREKKILSKAFKWAAIAFFGYVLVMAWSAFFIIGGGGVIRVVHLPVFFFVGLFVSQLVQTAMMLILYNMSESDDG
ncbi:MAG: hypothetical protein KAT00_08250 [Planctomycetes bacterium]|nr:hypothetical protein [Planctomycetota bacterium]